LPDFHTGPNDCKSLQSRLPSARHRENPRPACLLRDIALCSCTKSGHPPVDGLHSIENKADKAARFLLTAELESVQRESFFDSFSGFSGWCGVRGSSWVTLNIAK
jgi:hypothetical protein